MKKESLEIRLDDDAIVIARPLADGGEPRALTEITLEDIRNRDPQHMAYSIGYLVIRLLRLKNRERFVGIPVAPLPRHGFESDKFYEARNLMFEAEILGSTENLDRIHALLIEAAQDDEGAAGFLNEDWAAYRKLIEGYAAKND